MQNNLKKIYSKSITKKVLEGFFLTSRPVSFTDGTISKIFRKFNIPFLSEILTLLSIAVLWYEMAIPANIPIITQTYFPLLLLFLAFLFCDKSKIILSKSHFYYLFFLAILLVSGTYAFFNNVNPKLILLGFVLFFQFGFLYIMARSYSVRILSWLVYLFLPMTFVAIYQLNSGLQTSKLWISPFESGISTRVFGFLSSPNVLGVISSIICLLSLSIFIKTKKVQFGLISALNLMVIFGTFSRSAWIGFAVGVFVMAGFINFKYLYFSPLSILLLFSDKIRSRIFVVFNSNYLLDSSLDGRIWSLKNGLHIFSKHPLIGTGAGTYGGQLAQTWSSPVYLESIQNGYTALYYTDNQFLEILVQGGLIGFALFLFFVISSFVELVKSYNKTGDVIKLGAIAAMVSFLISGIFANVLEFGAVAIPMALIIGVCNE